MKAIIVAGGQGTRLRPLTNTIPKPMVRIAGKPILEHTINLLKKHGITDFVIALCYLPDVIISYFGDGSAFGVKIKYTYEDPNTPLGTAGAIFNAHDLIHETCIVTYADILRELDVTDMILKHKASKSTATLNVYIHAGGKYKSSLSFDENNRLTQFIEQKESIKRESNEAIWSNGSFYIFEPEVFNYIPENTQIDFAQDIFPKILQEGKLISVFPSFGYFIDIGTIEKLTQAEKDLAEKKYTLE